jgi:hypothetical protein
MNLPTFIYLSFGKNLNNHTQAIFSILTVRKFAPQNSRFVVYTDQEKYYNWVKDFVEIRLISKETFTLWEGEYRFVWRIKLMAMLDSATKDLGHLVYLDVDTFVFAPLSPMMEALDKGMSFMHLPENTLSSDKAKYKKTMWLQTRGKTFGSLQIDENSMMWNAGVVALSSENKSRLLNQALICNDQMCAANVSRQLIEQFSLSLALHNSGKMDKASKWIGHYWGNKEEWNHNIHYYFSGLLQSDISIHEAIELLDISIWKQLPISRSKQSLNKHLSKFAQSKWPDLVQYTGEN